MTRLFIAMIGAWLSLGVLAHSATAQSPLPQRTMDWQALAERIVAQLQLEPGEDRRAWCRAREYVLV